MRRITVGLDPAYDVVVGAGALAAVADVVGDRRRVAIVSQAGVAAHHASALLEGLDRGEVFLMGDGEEAKTLATVEDLARRMARWGLARDDAIVALGGGVVGDVAGFTAATYHRGITIVQAPTTLLAMVDAAIGGKTAVNLPEGKNLLGALHQPAAVLCDVTTLATLADREFRSGMGEVAKYALMGDVVAGVAGMGDLAAAVSGAPGAADDPGLIDLVARAAAIKAAVVAADPHERTGLRATLNYGHTLAHALETAPGYALTHGEAVAVGLVFALRLAEGLERLAPDVVTRSVALVASLGLPTAVPAEGDGAGPAPDPAALIELMARDKKARGGLTFILDGPNGLERVDDPPERLVRAALAGVGVGERAGMGD